MLKTPPTLRLLLLFKGAKLGTQQCHHFKTLLLRKKTLLFPFFKPLILFPLRLCDSKKTLHRGLQHTIFSINYCELCIVNHFLDNIATGAINPKYHIKKQKTKWKRIEYSDHALVYLLSYLYFSYLFRSFNTRTIKCCG